jgi:hypothetical protein
MLKSSEELRMEKPGGAINENDAGKSLCEIILLVAILLLALVLRMRELEHNRRGAGNSPTFHWSLSSWW